MAEHFNDITIIDGGTRCHIDMSRINRNLDKAQYALDTQIMTDMEPLMPFAAGSLIQRTQANSQAMAGTGSVMAAAPPYGRFLYYGKVMVGVESNSPWARYGEKKVVTGRDLIFSRPGAVPYWFEAAKERHLKEWVDIVKKVIAE